MALQKIITDDPHFSAGFSFIEKSVGVYLLLFVVVSMRFPVERSVQ